MNVERWDVDDDLDFHARGGQTEELQVGAFISECP
jgi:hypothetical protein